LIREHGLVELAENISTGLAGRLQLLVGTIDRLDRLDTGSGDWLENFDALELEEEAGQLVLRALHVLSDPRNYIVLEELSKSDSVPLQALVENTQLGRVSLTERLNDLAQVGFASRLIDTDYAQITAAGASAVDLVQLLSAQLAEIYKKRKNR